MCEAPFYFHISRIFRLRDVDIHKARYVVLWSLSFYQAYIANPGLPYHFVVHSFKTQVGLMSIAHYLLQNLTLFLSTA